MNDPREVFEYPEKYWEFLTASDDAKFEGQYFDRKEAGRVGSNGKNDLAKVIQQITECISAFANTNKSGSLLVLGISTKGEIKGISHLSDAERIRLTKFEDMLCNQAAQAKFFDCKNESGNEDEICLIYVPYTIQQICETIGNSPKAWIRQGYQNTLLDQLKRMQLIRDKKIVDFEQTFCCPYEQADIDQGLFKEFIKALNSNYDHNDEQLLYQIGALIKDQDGYNFTNAGLFFFTANPQRVKSYSYIRLLRFESNYENKERGLPTFEKKFGGSITKQIRDIRTFFRESGFFKLYQKRNPDGGFTEEPEYPYLAIDEAVVNAVAHREYAITLPIECESYKDAFIVRNPGKIIQRNHDVPAEFSLENTILDSTPRNPKLIEWLKMMRDERGSAFVRALSEGTKTMQQEMNKLNLPAPKYEVTESQTTVILYNNYLLREAAFKSSSTLPATEFTNLFSLNFILKNGGQPNFEYLQNRYQNILIALKDSLAAKGWYIDNLKFSRIIAHRQGQYISQSERIDKYCRFYPSYSFQIRQYWNKFYLCIDYTLQIRNIQNIQNLLKLLDINDLIGKRAVAQWNGWQRGKILSINNEFTNLYFFDFKQESSIPNNKVIPDLPISLIENLVNQLNQFNINIHRIIKEQGLTLQPNASRIRSEKTYAVIKEVSQSVFPLTIDDIQIFVNTDFTSLSRHINSDNLFKAYSLSEPSVEFSRHQESPNIREGIIQFGSYNRNEKNIEIIPICEQNLRESMETLINRLKLGKYKYKGSERTFSTRFTHNSIITTPSITNSLKECERLLKEHPEWIGDKSLNRVFLVHTPENGYSSDDENSPYYQIKRFILEKGIPCQMLDTSTINNPDWKDLNLALNIVAKCGVTPWVLPGAIPDADFFIGLSYTQNQNHKSTKLMGYANVFNQYGRWEFYCGNTETFVYEERKTYFQNLIKQTLSRLPLSETPTIYFHYSAKFSREDRKAIVEAARSIKPQGNYIFIWINKTHQVRFYDTKPETDGSLGRGNYVITSPHQFYISTTGYNPYRKALGTPQMLEINCWVEKPIGITNHVPDLKSIATQILYLTKLNWASTDSLCSEPITTKYAGNIAYLTAAFLRQNQSFKLHPTLENTPWFI
jgi:predicted HTH transcriptional regulator